MALIGTFIAITLAVTECLSTQLCGKRLADMLDLVCDGRGFHWTEEDDRHLMNKRTAMQYLMTSSQVNAEDGGVVNECCLKTCSMEHLEKYCAAGSGTYSLQPHIGRLDPDMARVLHNPPSATVPPTTSTSPTPETTTTVPRRPSNRFLSRGRLAGPLQAGAKFFFVRPVGPRPTRTPVYK